MKRIDSKSAEDASPVEITMRIIDALIDAVKSQEGELIITFKQDLKGIGDPYFGTGVRIEYGGCNTFIETLGYCKGLHNVSDLTGVFRYLSKALARWDEVERNEVQIALDNEHKDAWKQAEETRQRFKSASTRDTKYLADSVDIKDSSWWGLQREVGGGKSAEPARETSRPHTDPPQPETGPSGRTHSKE